MKSPVCADSTTLKKTKKRKKREPSQRKKWKQLRIAEVRLRGKGGGRTRAAGTGGAD